MQRLMLLFFALISFANAHAQISFKDQLEMAKFDIVKRTIEFLSTDTATFKNIKYHTCDQCKTFDDLKKFSTDNNLINAGKAVIDPLSSVKIDTASARWRESLEQFKLLAQNKITGTGREKRKQMSGYNDYTASLNAIVKEVVPDGEPPASMVENLSQTASGKSLQVDTVDGDTTSPSDNKVLAASSPFLSYGIAAILLGLAIYLAVKNNDLKKGKAHYKKQALNADLALEEKNKRIAELSGKVDKLKEKLKEVELAQKNSDDLIKDLNARKEKIVDNQQTDSIKKSATVQDTKPFVQKPKQNVTTLKYAKYADMGDGFSNSELLDNSTSETIFEVTLSSGGTGEYKVTTNPEAQKYALLNTQYFFGKTCLYDSFPFDNSTIQTDSPGTIKLSGGKWTIITPAKISFV